MDNFSVKISKNIYLAKLIVMILVFFSDRVSKIYILNFFQKNQIQEIAISKFFNITLIWNEGIAFGLLKFDNNTIYNITTLIITLISVIILFYALKTKNFTGFFYAIIFGGALGNLYDRIFFNSVPDFIDLHINNFHWFIFNIADIFITIGVIGLICSEIFLKKND